MKLINRKTNEMACFGDGIIDLRKLGCENVAEMIEAGWEDYEESKKHYEILAMGAVMEREDVEDEMFRNQGQREIGNYFETKEEAERAVKKLKAWKRLKEAGFEFGGWTHTPITKSLTGYNLHIKAYSDKLADYMDDLELIFGDEE